MVEEGALKGLVKVEVGKAISSMGCIGHIGIEFSPCTWFEPCGIRSKFVREYVQGGSYCEAIGLAIVNMDSCLAIGSTPRQYEFSVGLLGHTKLHCVMDSCLAMGPNTRRDEV